MRVLKYIPGRMFGFLSETGGPQVFFHLRAFRPGNATKPSPHLSPQLQDWLSNAPPPIIGEEVEVTLENDPDHPENTRASRVDRVNPAVALAGKVETFDVTRGYGFIHGDDGRTYYLHRSEVVEGRIPIAKQRVMFYTAERKDKARACHIKICPEVS